jgi:enoyl-CoA hydratase/carnithine racemase
MARGYRKIRVARSEGVETITLHYPERRNAIGIEMTNELLYAIEDARQVDEVRVIVLTGEGNAFCAGGDFGQMSHGATIPPTSEPSTLAYKGDYADLLLALARCDKPIVAKVNGHAVGGGLGLAAACSFAIASSEAQLGTPEINVGLFPMMIMAVLARLVPRRRLLEMMLTGEKIDATEAQRLGLVGQVVPPDQLDRAVHDFCVKLQSKSPLTIKLGLRAFAEQDDMPLEQALPRLRERLSECLATNDAQEGLMAFLEKRKPIWTGK